MKEFTLPTEILKVSICDIDSLLLNHIIEKINDTDTEIEYDDNEYSGDFDFTVKVNDFELDVKGVVVSQFSFEKTTMDLPESSECIGKWVRMDNVTLFNDHGAEIDFRYNDGDKDDFIANIEKLLQF